MNPDNLRFDIYERLGRFLPPTFAILIISVFFFPGCGVKAPPKPPREALPPVIDDLRPTIDGNTLKLSWTIPPEKVRRRSGLAGFIVHRSKVPLSEPDCPDCPVLFERAADIPIDSYGLEEEEKNEMTYSETLEKDFTYTYKVTAYSESGTTGRDSNYVKFLH